MKLVRAVSQTGFLCIIMYLVHIAGSETVNIGAIFSLDAFNGKVSHIAMMAALEDVNSDPAILGGHTLSLKVHDSNHSGFLGIMEGMQFMEMDTVSLIGLQPAMMNVLQNLANELHVPLFSFAVLDPTLSPKQYPYVFQMTPSDSFQMNAISDIVSYFRWTLIIAISTDDERGRNGISALGDKLTGKHCKIAYKALLPPKSGENESAVVKELAKVKTMGPRVLVLHTLATDGLIILKIAEQLGMMNDGYIWIATAWLPSILDAQPSRHIFKNTQGVLALRHHTPDSQRKRAFISRWDRLANASIGLNAFGLYTYDTVWVIAHAIGRFLRQGNTISFSSYKILVDNGDGGVNLTALSILDGGNVLCKIILETNMTGLTGPIWFDSERSLFNPSYDILNIVGSQLRQIGYWSNYSGLSVVAPEILRRRPQNRSSASQRLASVVWPGGSKKPPPGWVFPANGRRLRVGVPLKVSFKDLVYWDNQTHQVRGYCIDVFLAAIKSLPYDVPCEFILFGDGHQNPNYTELVSRVADGEFDAAVGDITITTYRAKTVDFSLPYQASGLVVVVPVRKFSRNAWAFMEPFAPDMWIGTVGFLLIVTVVIWILEKSVNDAFRGHPKRQVTTLLWFSFSTLFFKHREKIVSSLGKLVLLIWLFAVMIIFQGYYKATLTSFIARQLLYFPIKGIDSLIGGTAPIGYTIGSYVGNYLNEELNIPKSRLRPLNSSEHYAEALNSGRVAAVVHERPYLDRFLSKYCNFVQAGGQFSRTDWGFAFKKDYPLSSDISTALLQLSENGILQNISETWLGSKKPCGPQIAGPESDFERLHLDSFVGLFLICAVACIIALIIHFSSMIYQYWQAGSI